MKMKKNKILCIVSIFILTNCLSMLAIAEETKLGYDLEGRLTLLGYPEDDDGKTEIKIEDGVERGGELRYIFTAKNTGEGKLRWYASDWINPPEYCGYEIRGVTNPLSENEECKFEIVLLLDGRERQETKVKHYEFIVKNEGEEVASGRYNRYYIDLDITVTGIKTKNTVHTKIPMLLDILIERMSILMKFL